MQVIDCDIPPGSALGRDLIENAYFHDSYFAPLTKFAILPGKVFEYDIYLTLGTVSEIRERFSALHSAAK